MTQALKVEAGVNKRNAAAGIGAVVTAVTASLGGMASPADAGSATVTQASTGGETRLVGNFLKEGDGGANSVANVHDELFIYVPGLATDSMIEFDRPGAPGTEATFSVAKTYAINGNYRPVVGNFDADNWDEILFYAPGTATDTLYNFDGSTTPVASHPVANGNYTPFVGDFTDDGVDDIFWYAAGTAQDYIWDYNADNTYRSLAYVANGTYVPLVGSFGNDGTDDILWYAAGTGQDYLWDFNGGSLTYASSAYVANGNYTPFTLDIYDDGARGGDIFWYAPGPAQDYIWDFVLAVKNNLPTNAPYVAKAVGGDFFGDAHDDALFLTNDGFTLWDHSPVPGGVQRYIYSFYDNAMQANQAQASSSAAAASAVVEAPNAATGVDAGVLSR
jgi:hypothetical protein